MTHGIARNVKQLVAVSDITVRLYDFCEYSQRSSTQ